MIAFNGRYATLPQTATTQTTVHLIHGGEDRVIDLAWAVSAQERLQELGEMSRWISLKISDMPLMTVVCSLPSTVCVIPYRSTILMKR